MNLWIGRNRWTYETDRTDENGRADSTPSWADVSPIWGNRWIKHRMKPMSLWIGRNRWPGRRIVPRPGQILPRSNEPMNLWIWRNRWIYGSNGTEEMDGADFTPSGADFSPIGRNRWILNRMEPMDLWIGRNRWTGRGRLYPVRADISPIGQNRWIYESDGTDEFMKRTEPLYWTGQILPHLGQILPRSDGTDECMNRTEPMNY